jgi:hypothetical protein
MLRSETQLRQQLGEPCNRYDVNVDSEEIWRWKCSCLAVRVEPETLKWSPCDMHRPTDWAGFREEG